MTIEDSRPAEQITIKLEFLKPFQATNTSTFKFSPTGDGTQAKVQADARRQAAAQAAPAAQAAAPTK